MDNLTSRQSVAAKTAVMPNLVPQDKKTSVNKIRNDFIRHPQQFPLEFRRTRGWGRSAREKQTPNGDLGLSFMSPKRIPPGTTMELSIPLRGDVQKFQGTVVMVREIATGSEISLWLVSADDASRARLVEQICHLECVLSEKSAPPRARVPSSRPPKTRVRAGFPQLLPN